MTGIYGINICGHVVNILVSQSIISVACAVCDEYKCYDGIDEGSEILSLMDRMHDTRNFMLSSKYLLGKFVDECGDCNAS